MINAVTPIMVITQTRDWLNTCCASRAASLALDLFRLTNSRSVTAIWSAI